MTPKSHVIFIRIAVSFLSLLLVGSLILFVKPTLLSGGYYEITIKSVAFEPDGKAIISYEDRLAHGTVASWKCSQITDSSRGILLWHERTTRILHWPRAATQCRLEFWLASHDERQQGVRDSDSLRQRFLLKPQTYRIKAGENLVFHRIPNSDGTTARESWIQVISWPQ
jgi:hypothetical protein